VNVVRVIESYVHAGRIGVLVELSCESDYATRTDEFKSLARNIAMHIAASSPASVPSLLEQPYVKDLALTVGQLVAGVSSTLRERVCIVRFVRWDASGGQLAQPEPEPPSSPAVAVRARPRA
jgi:elongation factor Ts